MGCKLDKFTTYNVGQVVRDRDKITVQILNPPADCPDKAFSTHKGKIVIQSGISPVLTYSNIENKPIVLVPSAEVIQEVQHDGMGFLGILAAIIFVCVAVAGLIWIFKRALTATDADTMKDSVGSGRSFGFKDTEVSFKDRDVLPKSYRRPISRGGLTFKL